MKFIKKPFNVWIVLDDKGNIVVRESSGIVFI